MDVKMDDKIYRAAQSLWLTMAFLWLDESRPGPSSFVDIETTIDTASRWINELEKI